jgi:hypothetical protein
MMCLGRMLRFTRSTTLCPASRAKRSNRSLHAATGALPGGAIPIASAMICMMLAVPMPAHTPGLYAATSHMALMSLIEMVPAASSPTDSNTSSISTLAPLSRPHAC